VRRFQSFAGRKTRDSKIGQGLPSMYRRAMTVPQLGRKGPRRLAKPSRGANFVSLSPAVVKPFARSIILTAVDKSAHHPRAPTRFVLEVTGSWPPGRHSWARNAKPGDGARNAKPFQTNK